MPNSRFIEYAQLSTRFRKRIQLTADTASVCRIGQSCDDAKLGDRFNRLGKERHDALAASANLLVIVLGAGWVRTGNHTK